MPVRLNNASDEAANTKSYALALQQKCAEMPGNRLTFANSHNEEKDLNLIDEKQTPARN